MTTQNINKVNESIFSKNNRSSSTPNIFSGFNTVSYNSTQKQTPLAAPQAVESNKTITIKQDPQTIGAAFTERGEKITQITNKIIKEFDKIKIKTDKLK